METVPGTFTKLSKPITLSVITGVINRINVTTQISDFLRATVEICVKSTDHSAVMSIDHSAPQPQTISTSKLDVTKYE